MATPPRRLEQVLAGHRLWPPPVWLMRQAGRYLPEYRQLRAEAGSFLGLCHNPKLAAEVTLQPIRRYGFDAAIVFSDILLVAGALGQTVTFEEGEGPVLRPALAGRGIGGLDPRGAVDALAPVCETLHLVRAALPQEVSLIGFCGGPWTVATYMAQGRSSSDHHEARLWAYQDREGFAALIDMLVEVSAAFLVAQVRAGAGVLKIFDSWAGILPQDEFVRWVIEPTRRLVKLVREELPDVPIIGFPRGAGTACAGYVAATGVDAVALDSSMTGEAARAIQAMCPVQGNVDPVALLAGGEALEQSIGGALKELGGGPLVFNLGHGVHKETPPEHVAALVRLVRAAPDPLS